MSFTCSDKQLAILKLALKGETFSSVRLFRVDEIDCIKGVVARLEAAELTITHAKDFAELQKRLKAWRKAKGERAGRVQE